MSNNCYRFSTRDDTAFRCGCGENIETGLPEVTNEDNGKVLMVSDGAWTVGDASGSSSSCDCPGLPTTKSNAIFNESFTADELIEYGTMYGMTYHYETQLDGPDYILTSGNQYVVTFNGTEYSVAAVAASGGNAYLGELNSGTLAIIYDNYPFYIIERANHKFEIWVENNNAASVEIKRITVGDNQVLATNSGEWVAVNPNNIFIAEPGYFEFNPEYDTLYEWNNVIDLTFNQLKAMVDSYVIPWTIVDYSDRTFQAYNPDTSLNSVYSLAIIMRLSSMYKKSDGQCMATFSGIDNTGAGVTMHLYAHSNNNDHRMYVYYGD